MQKERRRERGGERGRVIEGEGERGGAIEGERAARKKGRERDEERER